MYEHSNRLVFFICAEIFLVHIGQLVLHLEYSSSRRTHMVKMATWHALVLKIVQITEKIPGSFKITFLKEGEEKCWPTRLIFFVQNDRFFSMITDNRMF